MKAPHIIRDEPMRAGVCRMIAGLDLSKPWAVTVEPYKERRSLNQNSLLWKWNGLIAQETGNDVDLVHDTLKKKFLAPEEITLFGEKTLYRSTARLDTRAMSNYLEQVYAFATSELGILLPVPEDEANKETTT